VEKFLKIVRVLLSVEFM